MNDDSDQAISLAVGRRYFFDEILSLDWYKFQTRHYNIKEFGKKTAKWPNVEKLFYLPEVATGLKQVIRWSAYKHLPIYPQSTYTHTFGLTFLGYEFPKKMNGSLAIPLDKELMLKACLCHDIPEGIKKIDVPYAQKSVEQDVIEYLSFKQLIEKEADMEDLESLEKIYLLQFCTGEIEKFPDHAKALMLEMWQNYPQEILWFKFLENFDYLLYAEYQYVKFDIRELIAKVAAAQVPVINELVAELPHLKRIWTDKANNHFSQFIIST